MDAQNRLIFESRRKVLEALMQKSPQTFSQLLRATGLSSRTLVKALKRLQKEGVVYRQIQANVDRYPPPVLYDLTPKGHEALIPILFNIKAQNWVFGLKQSFENEFADMPVETLLQTIARRFFAYGLFCCLQTLKTQNNAWLEASSFSLTPELLAQLGLSLKAKMEIQPAGEYKGNSLMIYQIPEQEFEDKIKRAFPNEYHELQKILEEMENE